MKMACSVFHVIILILSTHTVECYQLDVIIEDEGVIEEELQFEITDAEPPPFETNTDFYDGYRDTIRGPVVTGYLGNHRGKRSLANDEVCMRGGGTDDQGTRLVVVEEGEDFHLPCHGCEEPRGAKFESLQWIKLGILPNKKGLCHLKEIISGMHENDKRNRIIISVDHRLTIKHATIRDSGNYFCTRKITEIVDKWLPWAELQQWIVGNINLKYYFHVDVLKIKGSNIVDVSEYSGTKPKPTHALPVLNVAVETIWHPWSKCSVCGEEGLRRRLGICMVKKLDKHSVIPNRFLESLLRNPETHLPCQSQLLRHFYDEKISNRPNEVQIEECLEPCLDRHRRSISKSELLSGEKDDKEKSKDKTVTEGKNLILVCPKSSLTRNPVWVNGTKHVPLMKLRKKTNERIKFDPIGNLMFAPVAMDDAGTYSCWMKGKMKRKFEVKVNVDNSAEVVLYGVYMGYVILLDFVVFVFLSVVKFMNRKVQIRNIKKHQRKDNSNAASGDETASLINETGDSSGRSSSEGTSSNNGTSSSTETSEDQKL